MTQRFVSSLVVTSLLLSACGAAAPLTTTPVSASTGSAEADSASSATSTASSPVAAGSDAPTATPSRLPPSGAVEPGTYHVPSSAWSVASYTITLPEGWHKGQYGYTFIKHSDQPDELGFYFVIVDTIFADPCLGEDFTVDLGPSVDDLATALVEQPFVQATQPVDTTLGGIAAKRIDLTVPADLDPVCRMGEHLQIWYSAPANKFFVLLADDTASVYILDIAGERQVFLTHYRAPATPDDVTEMQTIVDSIEIDS